MSPGALLLAGGAEFDERMSPADRAFLERAGSANARVAVLPTAAAGENAALAAANGVSHFRSLGAEAEAVMITDAGSAGDERMIEKLESADAVYMTGGNPLHVLSTLRGSPAWETMARRWREGAALGGSSAGAMVLCQSVFVQQQWAEGLGLVPAVVVLPHLNQRDPEWLQRARSVVAGRRLIGLGIDESTACLWADGAWTVAGSGGVRLLTAGGTKAYAVGDGVGGLPDPR